MSTGEAILLGMAAGLLISAGLYLGCRHYTARLAAHAREHAADRIVAIRRSDKPAGSDTSCS